MRFLGIDYGEAKIGLAISGGEIVQPYGIVSQISQISRICREEKIEKVVIGISEGKMAEKTRKFGEDMKEMVGLPIEYWDETLTSHLAKEKMIQAGKPRFKRKTYEHAISAALILQDYLDNNRL